jgi:hypothetical protein
MLQATIVFEPDPLDTSKKQIEFEQRLFTDTTELIKWLHTDIYDGEVKPPIPIPAIIEDPIVTMLPNAVLMVSLLDSFSKEQLEINFNVVEIATKIADSILRETFVGVIDKKVSENTIEYTELAQATFDGYYDMVYGGIANALNKL